MSRLKETFDNLKANNKKAFSVFLMSGYPDEKTFVKLLKISSDAGVDFIEVGMPFSDPSADGPIIKQAGTHALENETTVKSTISSIKEFRKYDDKTPIVWMGYFNSVFKYGIDKFGSEIKEAGVDGVLIVDLPLEESKRLNALREQNLDIIQLITPTTTEERVPQILKNASGFIYFVSIAGITGTKEAEEEKIRNRVKSIQIQTDLPVIVGFGIKTPEKARQINTFADGAIVGSALIENIQKNINKENAFDEIKEFVKSFSKS